jgi:hypothetical protein
MGSSTSLAQASFHGAGDHCLHNEVMVVGDAAKAFCGEAMSISDATAQIYIPGKGFLITVGLQQAILLYIHQLYCSLKSSLYQ